MENYIEKSKQKRREAFSVKVSKGLLWTVSALLVSSIEATLRTLYTLCYPVLNLIGLYRYHFYSVYRKEKIRNGLKDYNGGESGK